MDRRLLQDLAKTELHCHLDGSISMETIRLLADMAGIMLPQSDQELKKLVTVPEQTESLTDYLKTFDFIRPLLQTKKALQMAAYDVARQAAADNVIYIEIRFAPELSMDQGLSAPETVFAVLEGLKQAKTDFGIRGKVIACGMRQSPKELTRDLFGQLAELSEAGFAGFDFAGDEHGFPPAKIEDLIRYTQTLGRPLTFHAGECGCPNHIADSIALGIKRLGHVTAIHNQPEIIKSLVEHQVTAELCLTSNLQTKAVKDLSDFPYQELYDAGAKITINTDNRTVSDTNLTREYELFHQYFAADLADFLQFNRNAVQASFTSDAEKRDLLAKIEKLYAAFL
ncbi:adenosine deaminase [Streptococcus pantholopis]|uniref:Adenosine deaminase n=1 Tax=Streptococcus pantholopis TaxID=1811193 RepID=A0A172Q6I6_9STRE|nr:adenosine deaminase [Streptococcus pantholopis]AND79070.1 adenosine deaminase [Streptococcus pantholopis]